MACDHLDKRTFNNAMENILTNYNSISATFDGMFARAMEEYYDAWQSKKGFERVNSFYSVITEALDKASSSIIKNYNTMKDGGEAYARDQHMFLIIESITKKTFSMDKKDFSDDREIIIDDEKISTAGENTKKSLERIASCLNDSINQTASNEKFGYYSDGGDNPREAMHKSYEALEEALKNATNNWFKELENDLESDKQLRTEQKQAAAVQDSDFSGIFG